MSNLFNHPLGYISNHISDLFSNESKNEPFASFSWSFKKDELNPLDLIIKDYIENITKLEETPILLNNNNNYILNAKTDEEISKNKISTKKKVLNFYQLNKSILRKN